MATKIQLLVTHGRIETFPKTFLVEYDLTMMPHQPNEHQIMHLVRDLESKVRTCRAELQRARANGKMFAMGFAWGAGIAALACWYLMRHGA